jgi:hypothetical protein
MPVSGLSLSLDQVGSVSHLAYKILNSQLLVVDYHLRRVFCRILTGGAGRGNIGRRVALVRRVCYSYLVILGVIFFFVVGLVFL